MPDFSLSAKVVVTEADVSKLQAALNQLKNIKSPVDVTQMQGLATKTKELATATAAAQKQTAALQSQYKQMQAAARTLSSAKQSMTKLNDSTRRAAGSTQTLADRMKEIGPRALAFRVSTVLINGFVNAVRDAIVFLRDMDQIMADIKKISGQTTAQLNNMSNELIDIASSFGLAAQEVAEQFKTIIQAGFKAGAAMDVVKMAAMGSAATTLDFANATEVLIQTIKIFGEQDAATLFDQIAVAESNAAVTAKDIQDAMKRSAATFQAVNAPISDMIGLISSLQETSRRGGAVVGTAFRTINTRIVAGDTRKEVEKLGIAVTDYVGNIRPLVDILSDLSLKMSTLTEEERVQAATLIAGRRQFESFLQITNNIDRAQDLAAESAAAQGEAMKRAAIQAETVNAAINKLNNAFLKTISVTNQFIPVTEVFKDILSILTKIMTVADGAVAKFAALAGGIMLMKGMGKVLAPLAMGAMKGAGGTMGGGGLMAPAFGKGASRGLFGSKIGAPKNIQHVGKGGLEAGVGKAGAAATTATKSFSKLSLGLVGASFAISTLTGALGNAETATGRAISGFGDIATGMIGFAFGPLIGIFTTLVPVISKATSAITTFVDRQSAYNMSMSLFGSEELAQVEAALVDARAAGDNLGVAEGEHAKARLIAFHMIRSQGPKAVAAMEDIGNSIQRLRDAAPGAEIAMEDIKDIITKSLTKVGIDESVIQDVLASENVMQNLLQSTTIFTKDFSGLMTRTLDELLEAANKEKIIPTSNIGLSRDIFSDSEFIKGQQDFVEALKSSALANDIFVKGITDVIAIKRLQAEQEVSFAESAVEDQKTIFANALGHFRDNISEMEGGTSLDFHELKRMFEAISGGGRSIPDFTKALDVLGKTLEDAGVQPSKELTKSTLSIIADFRKVELAFVELGDEARKSAKAIIDADFEELNNKLNKSEVARKREQDVVKETADLLSGLDIDPTNTKMISQMFEQLSSKSKGSTDEMANFLHLIEELKNPISQARRELMDTINTQKKNVARLQDTRNEINAQIEAYKKQEPSLKRSNALKEHEVKLSENKANIDKAQAKALSETAKATKDVMSEQAKATKKVVETQGEFITSLKALAETTEKAMVEADADAQKELKDAQESVIESSEKLSDAYKDLRDAQLSLGDSVADYRIGVLSASREIDIINGNIRGFTEQFRSIQNVFDEVLSNTAMTEQKRLELLQESANQQLQLVQNVIDETISIGQKIFTMDAGGGAELTRGFASLREVIGQFQAGGGFEGIDLNDFGNTLLSLPQSIRQEMVNALSALPSTATLGGMSKAEIEKILFGSAVGESDEANIQNINDLTETQVELMGQIAELSQAGILSANAQLAEAQKQVALAEEQLALDEIILARAEENVQIVREEISTAAMLLKSALSDLASLSSASLDTAAKENIMKRATEHAARLSALQAIEVNTENFGKTITAFTAAVGVITGASRGHIPKNFAGGNMREMAGLVRAYHTEKRAAPGANPVIANDSEWIIPTKNRGNIPNYQAGNTGKIDVNSVEMERLLTNILETIQAQNQETEGGAISRAVPTTNTEPLQATININAEQSVKITGVTTVADAVANSIKRALGDTLNADQISMISEQMLEIFDVLRNRGLMNSLGGGL